MDGVNSEFMETSCIVRVNYRVKRDRKEGYPVVDRAGTIDARDV